MTGRNCALPTCGLPLQQRPTERNSHYRARRYCNRVCACTGMPRPGSPRPGLRVPPDTKPCEQCGTVFERRPWNEGPKSWARRRYCCHACSALARRGAPAPTPTRPRPAVRRRKTPAPAPRATPQPVGDHVWRPPGWSATPNVRGVA